MDQNKKNFQLEFTRNSIAVDWMDGFSKFKNSQKFFIHLKGVQNGGGAQNGALH